MLRFHNKLTFLKRHRFSYGSRDFLFFSNFFLFYACMSLFPSSFTSIVDSVPILKRYRVSAIGLFCQRLAEQRKSCMGILGVLLHYTAYPALFKEVSCKKGLRHFSMISFQLLKLLQNFELLLWFPTVEYCSCQQPSFFPFSTIFTQACSSSLPFCTHFPLCRVPKSTTQTPSGILLAPANSQLSSQRSEAASILKTAACNSENWSQTHQESGVT